MVAQQQSPELPEEQQYSQVLSLTGMQREHDSFERLADGIIPWHALREIERYCNTSSRFSEEPKERKEGDPMRREHPVVINHDHPELLPPVEVIALEQVDSDGNLVLEELRADVGYVVAQTKEKAARYYPYDKNAQNVYKLRHPNYLEDSGLNHRNYRDDFIAYLKRRKLSREGANTLAWAVEYYMRLNKHIIGIGAPLWEEDAREYSKRTLISYKREHPTLKIAIVRA